MIHSFHQLTAWFSPWPPGCPATSTETSVHISFVVYPATPAGTLPAKNPDVELWAGSEHWSCGEESGGRFDPVCSHQPVTLRRSRRILTSEAHRIGNCTRACHLSNHLQDQKTPSSKVPSIHRPPVKFNARWMRSVVRLWH